jgi:hypothetical protein
VNVLIFAPTELVAFKHPLITKRSGTGSADGKGNTTADESGLVGELRCDHWWNQDSQTGDGAGDGTGSISDHKSIVARLVDLDTGQIERGGGGPRQWAPPKNHW